MKKRVKKTKVLVLRTVDKDRKAYGGFQWPEKGPVKAPDWDPTPECGHGLHGCLRGEGDGSLLNWSPDALWQVVEVLESEIVRLVGKVKFPKGNVLFTGSRAEATEQIRAAYPDAAVIGATVTAGNYGTATAGDYGTATAGNYGTATAGNYGTATAGDCGIIVLRYWDNKANRYRIVVGYPGEDGIVAGKKYRLDDNHKFVEVAS